MKKKNSVTSMVEKFQCPGCVAGNGIDCGSYQYDLKKLRCVSHVLGTHVGLGNKVALGLPKGFNKPGFTEEGNAKSTMDIRLFLKGDKPDWDFLNIPVWAMEKNGFLFVRTYAPRINLGWVDVIEGGTKDLCPAAIDIADFLNEFG